jgi:hypothetical protein
VEKQLVGWREWVALPALGVDAIKAKVDTGAKTSAIHAYRVHRFRRDFADVLAFTLHPDQENDDDIVSCEAPLLDVREVTSSTGHCQTRFVIETDLELGSQTYPIQLTLTNRDQMGFRMLLGRQALKKRFLVDPGKSFMTRGDRDEED